MAGDKLRQPCGFSHAIECPAWGTMPTGILVPERGRYPHKGSDRSPTISIFWQRSWHSWVNRGVSLPHIRLLAARQTAQGRCFVNNPPTASAPPPAAGHSRQRQRLTLTAPQCACCTRRRRRTDWVPRPAAWSPARPVAPPLRWRCSLPCYARTARSAAGRRWLRNCSKTKACSCML